MKHYILLVFFLSCRADTYSPSAYAEWMNNNRNTLSATVSGTDYTTIATYLPADWLAIREAGSDNPVALKKVQKEYTGLEYYQLRVKLNGGQGDILQYGVAGTDEYYQRVDYLSFQLQQDIRLLTGPDTMPCRLFHFERNYGTAPYADFMLGFDTNNGNKSDRALLFDDRVFTRELILLTIPFKNIQNIPNLKL